MNKKVHFLLPMLCGMLTSGCFGVVGLELKENMEDLDGERAKQERPAPARVDRDIAVQIRMQPDLGCIVVATDDDTMAEELGAYTCALYAMKDPEPTDRIKERSEKYETPEYGIHIPQVAEVFAQILQQRLSERFRKATGGQGDIGISMAKATIFHDWNKLGAKRGRISVVATLGDGTKIQVQGQGEIESNTGHMAWLVPLGVLTFPLGVAIGGAIADNIWRNDLALIMLMAMDDASIKLAEKLAAAGTSGAVPASPPPAATPPAATTSEPSE